MQLTVPVICKDLVLLENLARYSNTSFYIPYYFWNNGVKSAVIEIGTNTTDRHFPLETIIMTEEIGLGEMEPLSVEVLLHNLYHYPKTAPKEVRRLNFFDRSAARRNFLGWKEKTDKYKDKFLAFYFKEIVPLPQASKTRTTYYIWSQVPEDLNQNLIRRASQHPLPQTP